MNQQPEPPDIVTKALFMAMAVEGFAEHARTFYYAVMLSGHNCPGCGGEMEMYGEGGCVCRSCGSRFDPTLAFQRCAACGGKPSLQVRRYRCEECGADIRSRFLFDGLVFDAEYFRQKMAEHRQRKTELRDRVRRMLAESRSGLVEVPPANPEEMSDLLEALDGLAVGADPGLPLEVPMMFDLSRYQTHVQAHIGRIPTNLERIPPLSEDRRKDRVWRFVAIIFLAHAGLVHAWQDGQDVMVMKREAHTERQAVPGDLEDADGIEGPMGRAEAW